ncbi:MAG: MBL fold metallo-hydrolase [Gemmatimonadota bacterium]|nr:MBL fold metallo-hydrolase [Gemmatimonadota bacterium]
MSTRMTLDRGRPMLRRITARPWRSALLGLVPVLAVFLFTRWREASIRGGQLPAEPFRIAGNLYQVGANDIAAFLIAGPEGHVLIDGGYPGTPPLLRASIAPLGFDLRDVRILFTSEPHYDHGGGVAELQEASGAELWASASSADALESGGDDTDRTFLLRALVWSGLAR